MKLQIANEFDPLQAVVVCSGESMTPYERYVQAESEFTKFHPYRWDIPTLLHQQDRFFDILEHYHVKLLFPKTHPRLIWQMFTRDTAFVVGQKLYYANSRKFKERAGEVEEILSLLQLNRDQIQPVSGLIEGGDVIVSDNAAYIGHSSRTNDVAIKQLSSIEAKIFELGEMVMHLDTRLTLLPNHIALVNPSAFNEPDQKYLQTTYRCIEVSDAERMRLGTNVFVINPETILVPTEHKRIARELSALKFVIELCDYTEAISLGGSFRCTTMPLIRG